AHLQPPAGLSLALQISDLSWALGRGGLPIGLSGRREQFDVSAADARMANRDIARARRRALLPADAGNRGLDVRRDAGAMLRARLGNQARRRADRRLDDGAAETPADDRVFALHSIVGALPRARQRLFRSEQRGVRRPP